MDIGNIYEKLATFNKNYNNLNEKIHYNINEINTYNELLYIMLNEYYKALIKNNNS